VIFSAGVVGVVWGAGAAKKPAPVKPAELACGMHYMPMIPGYFWTYISGDLQVTIKIINTSDGGKDAKGHAVTKIDVEEQTPHQGPLLKLQWTCTKEEGLKVPPESFMFAGETGSLNGMKFEEKSHDGVSVAPDADFVISKDQKDQVANQGWHEDVKIDVTRTDEGGDGVEHAPAKLDLTRDVTVHPEADVECPLTGGHLNAIKATYELRGTVSLDGLETPTPLPVKRYTDEKNKDVQPPGMWFVKDLGIIRFQDAFDKDWELRATNIIF
jgi:hypothetical protein